MAPVNLKQPFMIQICEHTIRNFNALLTRVGYEGVEAKVNGKRAGTWYAGYDARNQNVLSAWFSSPPTRGFNGRNPFTA